MLTARRSWGGAGVFLALDTSSGGFLAHVLWPVLLSCSLIPAVATPETDPGGKAASTWWPL